MGRTKLLTAILIVLNLETYAQSVKGKLLNAETNRPLRAATLSLTSLKDSTRKFNAISDTAGNFRFNGIRGDSFVLKVSHIGYSDFKRIIGLRDTVLDLGTLLIPKSVKQLSEVT